MWASTSLRALLAGLLVVSALFAVGSTLERHQHGSESTVATHQEGSGKSSGEPGGESGTAAAHPETHREAVVTILGINTESVGPRDHGNRLVARARRGGVAATSAAGLPGDQRLRARVRGGRRS